MDTKPKQITTELQKLIERIKQLKAEKKTEE